MRRQKERSKPLKKPTFYCDEDFPKPSLRKFKNFKIKHAVIDFSFQGRDDLFHFEHAFKKNQYY